MPNTPLSRIPYPSGSDAPAAAADMMALVMAADSRLVLPAIDEADRDARYYDAPASSLVVSGQSQKIWLKTGPESAAWKLIFGDTGWVTEGFVVGSGWSMGGMKARRHVDTIDIRGYVTRTGDDLRADDEGNLGDTTVVSVPPQFRPESGDLDIIGTARSQYSSGAVQLYSSGDIRLLDLHANSAVRNGHYIRMFFNFLGA